MEEVAVNAVDELQVEIEANQEHSEMEEKALLAELEGADFDPSAAVAGTSVDASKLEAGKATAFAVVNITEQALKHFGHKQFTFDADGAENVANAAAPLFVKYGGELPPWLADYKEEITFVLAAGALGFSSFSQLKALKAADRAKEVKSTESEEADAAHQSE